MTIREVQAPGTFLATSCWRVPRDDVKHSPEWESASVVFGDHGEVFGRLHELVGQLSPS